MNPQPIISKDQMAKLLGRSLTSVEDTNYQLYLDLTVQRLSDLLCIPELADYEVFEIDLQLLIARLFSIIGVEQRTSYENIESKKVEDFSVNYDASSKETPMSRFINTNLATIAKYSQCQGKVLHGRLFYGDGFRFI